MQINLKNRIQSEIDECMGYLGDEQYLDEYEAEDADEVYHNIVFHGDNSAEYEAGKVAGMRWILDELEKQKTPIGELETLIKYTLENEEKHYEESGGGKNHIYAITMKVKDWFNSIKE